MTTLHDFSAKTIDGTDLSLKTLAGKVVLVINVASKCGLTPQYDGLEKLYEEFRDRGLVLAGFPANDFGAQEPGTEAEIKTFCSTKYNVTFPMFSKITVKGNGQHALYEWLTSTATPPGDITWNFEKFLIGRDGKIVSRFQPTVTPAAKELRDAVVSALG